jgi:hypothetical protein
MGRGVTRVTERFHPHDNALASIGALDGYHLRIRFDETAGADQCASKEHS